jgi:Na+-driven multidrug efflux pump
MVFMGRYKGAGELDKADRLFKQNRRLAFGCNLILSLLVLTFHRPLMGMFTSNTEIINAAGKIFLIDIFVQLPRAINNISESSLSANGDVRITFITSTLSCWLGSVALSYLLCVVLGFGLVGLWIAFACDETFKSIVYIIRWRSGRWKNIEV